MIKLVCDSINFLKSGGTLRSDTNLNKNAHLIGFKFLNTVCIILRLV